MTRNIRRLVAIAGVSTACVAVANDTDARGAFRAVFAAATVATLIVDYKTSGEARYGEVHERSAARLRKNSFLMPSYGLARVRASLKARRSCDGM